MSEPPGDGELLRRARAGEREAFDQLCARWRPRVLGFVRRLVDGFQREEELVQETFLALWLSRGKLLDEDHLAPFLFRVARNLCYSELRRRGAYELESCGDLDFEAVTAALCNGEPTPDEQLQQMLLLAELRQAIDSLPAPQREALILFADANLSYPQIAAATGSDLGTVKSRVHHARRNLRRRLRPEVLAALGVEPEERDERREPVSGTRECVEERAGG